MQKFCILLVLITQVYHNTRFEKRNLKSELKFISVCHKSER